MTDYERKQQEILEQESKASQLYNKITDRSVKNAELTLNWIQKYFTQILLTVLSFFMIGIQQFAEAKFDPYFFLRANFWFEYIPFVASQWIILFAVVTGNIKWLSEIEEQYQKETQLIQDHVDKDRVTPYISIGCKIADKERKIYAYRIKMSRKIEKILNKYNFGTFSQIKLFVEESELSQVKIKSKRKAIRLRKRLENMLQSFDDKWCDENIQNIKIKYDQVTESGLINGFVPTSNETYQPNFKENLSGTMVNEFGYGQMVTMILGFVILSLDLVAKSATITTWVMFTFKMVILFWAYFKANSRSKTIFKKTTLKALQERRKELDRIELKYKKSVS